MPTLTLRVCIALAAALTAAAAGAAFKIDRAVMDGSRSGSSK